MAKRKLWNSASMQSAIRSVLKSEMGLLKASKAHNVPKSTLKDYVRRIRQNKTDDIEDDIHQIMKSSIGHKTVLPPLLEKELVDYCIAMDKNFFGLRRKDIQRFAYQLAEVNKLKHTFRGKAAGKKWLLSFLGRHPEVTFRKPQSISVARVQAFTKENVGLFFDILKPELQKIKFNGNRVFNVDETGITVVQHNPQHILSVKGKKEVHKLSSAERGALITVVMCMSAGGFYVPPMLIFPRKNRKLELGDGAPHGSLIEFSPSGWITSPLFTQWFAHFVQHTRPSAEDPVVLVFDGHFSHTRNLELVEMARSNHVTLVCIPPHTSNKTQPLDVAFMKPFKSYYSQAIETWIDNHSGRVLTHYNIAPLFTEAYAKAATLQVAMNAFKKTGIIPFNPNIFEDHEFITEEDQSTGTSNTSNMPMTNDLVQTDISVSLNHFPATPQSKENVPSSHISPHDIRPIPVVPKAPPSTRRGTAKVISSSPHKNALIVAQQKAVEKEERLKNRKNRLVTRKAAAKNRKIPSTRSASKKEELKPSYPEEENEPTPGTSREIKHKKSVAKKRVKKPLPKTLFREQQDESAEEDDPNSFEDDDDAECPFCGWRFSQDQNGQKWISCSQCHVWCHEVCDAAIEEVGSKKNYICSICLNS